MDVLPIPLIIVRLICVEVGSFWCCFLRYVIGVVEQFDTAGAEPTIPIGIIVDRSPEFVSPPDSLRRGPLNNVVYVLHLWFFFCLESFTIPEKVLRIASVRSAIWAVTIVRDACVNQSVRGSYATRNDLAEMRLAFAI